MNKKELRKSRRIHILINESLNFELSEAAKKSGVTKSAFVQVALERELAREQKLDQEIKSREPA